jgi:hypothetical protein
MMFFEGRRRAASALEATPACNIGTESAAYFNNSLRVIRFLTCGFPFFFFDDFDIAAPERWEYHLDSESMPVQSDRSIRAREVDGAAEQAYFYAR